ncbi:hypothetical protein [Profundibacter sp.]
MQGWKIFTHSLGMVFNNLGAALRISGVLYLIQAAVSVYYTITFSEYLLAISSGAMPPPPDGAIFTGLMVVVVSVFVPIWIAVAWHRYILLEENPGAAVPTFHGPQIMVYLGKSILIGLLLVGGGMAVGGISVIVLGIFGSYGLIAGMVLAFVFMIYISYRIGLVLPAAALGKKMAFGEAQDMTSQAKSVVFQLAIITIGFGVLTQLPSYFNADPASAINIVYSQVTGWIVMMLGISILTTLYGVYVENREL